MLEGFKPFDFNEGVAYMSVTSNGVTFNKATTMKLHYPEWVVLLINEATGQIALCPCSEGEPNSAQFYKENARGILSVRWNSKDLLNTIEAMMEWDLEKESYRTEGVLLRPEPIMIFNLHEATPMG